MCYVHALRYVQKKNTVKSMYTTTQMTIQPLRFDYRAFQNVCHSHFYRPCIDPLLRIQNQENRNGYL